MNKESIFKKARSIRKLTELYAIEKYGRNNTEEERSLIDEAFEKRYAEIKRTLGKKKKKVVTK